MNLSPEHLLWILLLAPLGAAVLSALFFRRSRWGAPVLSCAAAFASLAATVKLLLSFSPDASAPFFSASHPWLTLGAFKVDIGFFIDANAALMLFVVSFVAFWIHIFSIGYMDDDKARGRFFAGLSIFLFSMLGIVVADNLYMVFAFWELVGFSSYMLIAHYHDRPDAVAASKKAFIVNRIGDLGFLSGIVLCHAAYGTVNLAELAAAVAGGAETSVLIGFLLLCGFLGKSAQFPLHIWLTDAMAGPTPVSALIHAATMVAAGVYFMVRVFFLLTPPVLDVMLWSCSAMALLAALCALAQTDIKKSLAYSTLSHLGFMGAAIGLRLPEIALLHLTMHAFFKGTLFLCAGSVIRACHHEQDMTKMGGLWRRMPVTTLAFLIAGASLCAFPATAGWFSKDAILSGALLRNHYGVAALLLAAALGSALYIGRIGTLVFLGKANSEPAGNARESRAWVAVPVAVLGIFATGLAAVSFWPDGATWAGGAFNGIFPAAAVHSLAHSYHALHGEFESAGLFWPMLPVSFLIVGLGVGGAVWFYRKTPGRDALCEKAPRLYRALEYRWVDTLCEVWLKRVQQPFANVIGFFDTLFVNGLGVRAIGAGIPGLLGLGSRQLLHTGRADAYLFWPAVGALLYVAVMFWQA